MAEKIFRNDIRDNNQRYQIEGVHSMLSMTTKDMEYFKSCDIIHGGEILPFLDRVQPSHQRELTVTVKNEGKFLRYNGQTFFNTVFQTTAGSISFGALSFKISGLTVSAKHKRIFIPRDENNNAVLNL